MSTRSFALTARVNRPGGIRLVLPLVPGPDTRFIEEGEPLPADVDLLAVGDAVGTEDALSLHEVFQVLWPAGFGAMAKWLEATFESDNRVDLEERLAAGADLLLALLSWWNDLEERTRHPRLRVLRAFSPLLAELLESPVPAGARTKGPYTGHAPWELVPGWFDEPAPGEPAADGEAWEAWSSRGVDEVLGEGGALSRVLGEGFETREGQLEMARKVAEVLERDEHLMVEAGTGIGKTLAYLVPALLHGARERERVVISTWTKALQHQLMEGDLPLLKRFGYPGHPRLLLGRNNYLCTRQFRRAMHQRPEDRESALAQLALFCWRYQSADGRREELNDHPFFLRHWKSYFESVEPCSPHICHREPLCFVVAARRRAREAPVVVVNHSLLMMDLRSAQSLLGPSKLLIVDEAHELEAVATQALSRWVRRERLDVYRNLCGEKTPGGLREVVDNLVRAVQQRPGSDRLLEAARSFDRALDGWLNAFIHWFDAVEGVCRQRLQEESHGRAGRHRYHDGDEAFGEVRPQTGRLMEAAEELRRSLADLIDVSGDFADLLPQVQDEREGLASLLSFHTDLVESIRFCLAADDEDWVYWFEWGGNRGLIAVVAAPLTLEDPLAELWDEHYKSVVMTSATLTVAGDFTPFAESVGFSRVSRMTHSLQIPSPFRFEEQALVLTTPELVDPKDDRFAEIVAEILERIGLELATKTLMLSTSYQFIDRVWELLRPVFQIVEEDLFESRTYRSSTVLLRQTPTGSREQLMAAFRQAPAAILLATGSFWEGVDFPGEELEVLVVPRMPFAVPTEPITQGRYERARRLGKDPFQEVALADAVLKLRQGVGRLLRSGDDRGVILLLDQRLQQHSYGVTFLQSMPRSCEWVSTRAEMADRVIAFLGS